MNFYFLHILSFINIFKEYFIAAPPSVKIFVQFFEHNFGRNLLVRKNQQRNGDLLAKPWSRRATIES